jgi:hypothetical protein
MLRGFRRSFPPGNRRVHQNNFQRLIPISPSVTSVASVRCFPLSAVAPARMPRTESQALRGSSVLSRPEAKLFTKQFSTPTPDFPSVTSLAL